MRLSDRVARIEHERKPDGGVIVMSRHESETDDAAVTRWRAENPGKNPKDAELTVILVKFGEELRP